MKRKDTPVASARLKRKRYDGQEVLLTAILKHIGGVSRIAELLNEASGTKIFYRQKIRSWRSVTKGIPLEHLKLVMDLTKAPPHALNYDDYSRLTGYFPPWKNVVRSCSFLAKPVLEEVLQHAYPVLAPDNQQKRK